VSLFSWLQGLFTSKNKRLPASAQSPLPVSHVFVVDSGVKLSATDMPAVIAPGLQAQLREDLAPSKWATSPLDVVRADAAPPAKGEVKICVHGPAPTDPADAGALALHDHEADGTPIIHTWYDLLQQYGASLSSAISHELLEARIDPEGNRTAVLPDGRTVAVEIADQVEEITSLKQGVEVSDFNLPSNFGIGGSEPPFDFLGKQPHQFQNMPGGYQQVLTDQGWTQITTSEHVPTTALAKYHAHIHSLGLSRRARRAAKHAIKRSLLRRLLNKLGLWKRASPVNAH
jgi:hypothetical protein